MQLAIDLSARNIAEGTGGPFGAAVFEQDTGKLVSVGVNRVVPSQCSHAHAEMLALALAQKRLGTYDLGARGLPKHELVASSEPCAMCYAAIPWSGIWKLVCGAKTDDVRAVGFDEGVKPGDWVSALEDVGIEVVTEVSRSAAQFVLQQYVASDGVIYHSRQD